MSLSVPAHTAPPFGKRPIQESSTAESLAMEMDTDIMALKAKVHAITAKRGLAYVYSKPTSETVQINILFKSRSLGDTRILNAATRELADYIRTTTYPLIRQEISSWTGGTLEVQAK